MTKQTRLFLTSALVALAVAILGSTQAEAFESNSSIEIHCNGCDEKGLRIMAAYDKPGWFWTDHITSGNWGYTSGSGVAYNGIILKQNKPGTIYPSFIVKSNNNQPTTATYTISYDITNPQGQLVDSDSELYRNQFFSSKYDGKADAFGGINGLPKGTTINFELDVHSIS